MLDFYLETKAKEIGSEERAKIAARHLKAFFGALLLNDCDLPVQEEYIDHRKDKGAANETIKRELGVLSAAIKYIKPRKRLRYVPDVISLPGSPPKERWLSRNELAAILRHFRADERRRVCAHLLLFTRLAVFSGARSSAILELTWDRVDLRRKLVDYNVPGAALTKKGRANVPIGPNLVRALKHAKRHSNSKFVITFRGEPCERIVRGFRQNMTELGLTDVTPHTLRHTFATWAAMKGQPLFLIGKHLGQSEARTTARYAKHQPEGLRSVTDAVWRK